MSDAIAVRGLPAAALLLAPLMLFAAACDDESQPPLEPEARASHASADNAEAEVYRAMLRPLNAHVSHAPVMGEATIRVQGDLFRITVNAKGLEPGIPHPQHIHGALGSGPGTCPDAGDDANRDGVVDVIEGVPDYGPILLTLDSDLSNGSGTEVDGLPNPENDGGAIRYRMSGSWSEIQAGLGGTPVLGDRHIVLHGVDPDTPLPEAQSVGGLPAWLTLPVACGALSPSSG